MDVGTERPLGIGGRIFINIRYLCPRYFISINSRDRSHVVAKASSVM